MNQSGRLDLNQRPFGPQPNALPDCATPRGWRDDSVRRHEPATRHDRVLSRERLRPTNNCIGIGDVLRRRGHRVVFIIEESFRGALEAKGFEERLMRLTPAAEAEEDPGQFWKDLFARRRRCFASRPSNSWRASSGPPSRLIEILDEVRPDVIVEDNVVSFPALMASGRPWVRILSCNPAELKDPHVPPAFSGYPSDNASEWQAYREEFSRSHSELQADFDAFCRERGAPALPELEFTTSHPSSPLALPR